MSNIENEKIEIEESVGLTTKQELPKTGKSRSEKDPEPKKKQTRISHKAILKVEGINSYEEKKALFENAMTKRYGKNYVSGQSGMVSHVKIKNLNINVTTKPMKIRSGATSNTVGIRAHLVFRQTRLNFGEYAGKFSMECVFKEIQKIVSKA